jgi:predicted porin
MKKSTIALAVAAALVASAAAQAETTLYGSIRAGIQWTNADIEVEDINSPGDVFDTINDGVWTVKDESSRWGIKGSEDLGNGLSAIYQVEWGFNTADNNGGLNGREQWVGLGGGFGRVRLGTTESPYYTVAGRVDVFITSFWNYSLMPNTRRNNALIYDLPGGLPVTGGVMVNMDGQQTTTVVEPVFGTVAVDTDGDGITDDTAVIQIGENLIGVDTDENGIDEYSAGVNFSVGPFGAGVGYVSDENADEDAWTVAASVDFFGASIGAAYESGDFDDQNRSDCGLASGDGEDSAYYAIEGQYKLGATTLRAGWNRCDPDNAENADGWAVGFSHNLSSRTLVALEYQQVEDAFNPDLNADEVAFQLRHNF